MTNILETLETAPGEIASANANVIAAEHALKMIRAKLAALRNAYTIKYREEKNARLIEACVESESDVQELVLREIESETQVKILKNKADRVYNEWISARKIGGMEERELHAISGSTIQTSSQRPQ
jgi:hypothetical protein